MRKHYSLAAHNFACNDFFMKYQDCQYEHPFRKYLGYCNDLEKQMRLCIKEQRQINREKNSQASKKRRERMRANKKEETNSNEPISKRIKSSSDVDNENEEETLLSNDEDDDNLHSFPPDNDITDMLEGVTYHGKFPTITERYFTAYYKLNVGRPADDICILMHSNRICMLGLAPSHVVLQNDKRIVKVDFKVSNKLDRVLNKVSGKSKHGAQPLQANSNICIITCSDEKMYTIKCCIIGKLVEVNEALLQNPELLLEPPHKGGYLAVVLPNIKLLDKMKESLLTQEQYDSEIVKRQNDKSYLEALQICSEI